MQVPGKGVPEGVPPGQAKKCNEGNKEEKKQEKKEEKKGGGG